MNIWPPAFYAQMQTLLGRETQAFFQAQQAEAPVSLRLNPRKLRLAQDVNNYRPVPWCSQGVYILARPVFTLDPRFHAGGYYVQDASCMLLEALFKQLPGCHESMRVLDLCAAPGGKATHLLQFLPEGSLLIANELIPARLKILEENLFKWGAECTLISQHSARDFQALPFQMDLILVDAPCSGEGLFRRQPEALASWSPAHIQMCARRQAQILQDIWPVLKVGGCLIYSTCTWNCEENEEVIAAFSKQQACELLELHFPTHWGIVCSEAMPLYRCFPHRLAGEGFSFCVLRKKDVQSGQKQGYTRKITRYKPRQAPQNTVPHALAEWLVGAHPRDLWLQEQTVWYWPEAERPWLIQVVSSLQRVSPGLPLAERQGKTWAPTPALALNPRLQKGIFPELVLNLAESLAYLRGESLSFSGRGWYLIRSHGLPLGWIKATPTHSNNAWPKAWKIRQNFANTDPLENLCLLPSLEPVLP